MRRTAHGIIAVFGCLALLGLVACGGSNKPNSTVSPATRAVSSPVAAAASQSPTANSATAATPTSSPQLSASPTETPDDSSMARLVIPKIGVNAKFVTLGIIASTNTMDSPKNKDDVAYYDFTPRPSYGGNTVLSGHVDWYTGQTGVFWDLKKLETGDTIQIVLEDGKTYTYKVTENTLYNDADAPVDEIIGDTPVESVTMITCEGVFDRSAAEYDKRRVVRAERVYS